MEGKLEYAGFFDGIGGFSLAAEQVGWNVNFHCEIDPFCDTILKYYWPNVKNYGNITTADLSFWRGRIDVLAGGFPCQPFSGAGNRNGTLDSRYLWPAMLKGIDKIRPTWVVAENVAGIFSMEDKSGVWKEVFFRVDSKNIARLQEVDRYEAVYTRQKKMLLDSIAQDLEKIGYSVQIYSVPAAGVGAIHKRERVWIVAHDNQQRIEFRASNSKRKTEKETIRSNIQLQDKQSSVQRTVTHSDGTVPRSEPGTDLGTEEKVRGHQKGDVSRELYSIGHDTHPKGRWSGRVRNQKRKPKLTYKIGTQLEWPAQSPICSGNDGLPDGLDGITFSKWRRESIKGYGNAIVPQCVLPFFEAIDTIERQESSNN